jgi:hypothetical protein
MNTQLAYQLSHSRQLDLSRRAARRHDVHRARTISRATGRPTASRRLLGVRLAKVS